MMNPKSGSKPKKRGRPKKEATSGHAQKQLSYAGKDVATRFKPGNQFWLKRSSHGRNPIFSDADTLRLACYEYIQWVDDNPLKAEKIGFYLGEPVVAIEHKMRMMTISGLCLFLDISDETWANYRNNPDFFGVVSEVERIIANQKLSGAAADQLNGNIVCREMGLREKMDHDHKINGISELLEAISNKSKPIVDE